MIVDIMSLDNNLIKNIGKYSPSELKSLLDILKEHGFYYNEQSYNFVKGYYDIHTLHFKIVIDI